MCPFCVCLSGMSANTYWCTCLSKTLFIYSYSSISCKKKSVTYSKYLLWKCLCIHQIRGENEEQKIKLTWPATLKHYSLNHKCLFWLHKIFFLKIWIHLNSKYLKLPDLLIIWQKIKFLSSGQKSGWKGLIFLSCSEVNVNSLIPQPRGASEYVEVFQQQHCHWWRETAGCDIYQMHRQIGSK